MHKTSTTNSSGTALHLSFGLVTVAVRLHKITDGKRTTPPRSMFTPDGNPVGQLLIDKVLLAEKGTIVSVDRGAVILKTQVGDAWVELTNDEIADQSTMTKGFAQIVAFVPSADAAANYRIEEEIEWRPDTVKIGKNKIVDPNAAKAVALLSTAMAARDLAALVLVPTTSGARYALLAANGRGSWVSFAAGVRDVPAAPAVEISDAELDLASKLIDQIGVGCPVLVDETGERLTEYLKAKAKNPAHATTGKTVSAVVAPVDIFAQLAASVDAAKATKATKPKRNKVAA